MYRNGFYFRGRHSSEFQLFVEAYPKIQAPKRKQSSASIPGRNGDLHLDENAFQNYKQSYECYFRGLHPSPEQAHEIKSWLMSGTGSGRLEDGYDPLYYRNAAYFGPMDVENVLNRFGRCVITFDCAPQCFLKSGELNVQFTASSRIHNSTEFPAKPLITIHGTEPGTLTIGGYTVEVLEISDEITLDCEMMNAYRKVGDGPAENRNAAIRAYEFPELMPGDNAISWTGGITGVDIIPRWWTL